MAKKGGAKHNLVRIKAAGQPDRTQDLMGIRYVFGRGDPSGQVHVDFEIPNDQHLSRAHCQFDRREDGYYLENLGANGTVVNGREITEAVPLPWAGDRDVAGPQHPLVRIGCKRGLTAQHVANLDAFIPVHRQPDRPSTMGAIARRETRPPETNE